MFRRKLWLALLAAIAASSGIPAMAPSALAGGLDTPQGVGNLPFNISGTQVMNMTTGGLTIGNNGGGWNYRLWLANGDGNHFILSTGSGGNSMVFGEWGGWYGLYDTSNGQWAATFYGDQNLTVGSGGGPGYLHLWGSSVYDNGDGLWLNSGSGTTNINGTATVGGNVNINGNQVWTNSGPLYLNYNNTSQVIIDQSLNISSNQVWNTSGDLYLNWSSPNNTVYIGGNGYQTLNIPNGQICLNGSCITQWPAQTNTIVAGNEICGTNACQTSTATCPGGYILSGGGYSVNSTTGGQLAPQGSQPGSSTAWIIHLCGDNSGTCEQAYAVCISQ